jgi:hypothetical protein
MAPEKQKNQLSQQKNLELRVMQNVIGAIGLLIFFSVLLYIYLLFGTQVRDMLMVAEPVAREETDRRLRARASEQANDPDRIENGIHVMTGLVAAEGWEVVRGTCTACHSAKLVTQNRATREGWASMITWMQETQGLWDLGAQEDVILDYLAANYAPEEEGRRPNLDVESIEWYVLNLD